MNISNISTDKSEPLLSAVDKYVERNSKHNCWIHHVYNKHQLTVLARARISSSSDLGLHWAWQERRDNLRRSRRKTESWPAEDEWSCICPETTDYVVSWNHSTEVLEEQSSLHIDKKTAFKVFTMLVGRASIAPKFPQRIRGTIIWPSSTGK